MNSTLCRTLRKMLADGFEQYDGVIDPAVYDRLKCEKPERAYWICNWPIMHCLGCNRRCTPKDIRGFQLVLPTESSANNSANPQPVEKIAALLNKKFLRPDEAAFCLNVSERKIRNWVAEGILITLKRKPIRITSESVKEEMDLLDI